MFGAFDQRTTDEVFFRRRRKTAFVAALALYGLALAYAFATRPEAEPVEVALEEKIQDVKVEEAVEVEEAPPEEAPPPKPEPKKQLRAPTKKVEGGATESAVPTAPPPTSEYDDAPAEKPVEKPKVEAPKEEAKPKPKAERPKKVETDEDGAIDLTEKVVAPVPDPGNKPPDFPPELKDKGITGLVVLKLLISPEGKPTKVKILKVESTAATEEEKEAAKKAFLKALVVVIKDWKYSPGLHDGQPVALWKTINVPFTLKG